MFTKEQLKNSPEFKRWVEGRIALIHNCYYDNESIAPVYIVVWQEMGKFTIIRFWKSLIRKDQLDKIHVSVDYQDLSSEEVFQILLSEYSRGLA